MERTVEEYGGECERILRGLWKNIVGTAEEYGGNVDEYGGDCRRIWRGLWKI